MGKTKRVNRVHTIPLLLLSLFFTLPTLSTAPVSASPDTLHVSISSFSFNPRDLALLEGDTVVWTNHDPVIHTLWFTKTTDQSTYLLSPPILPSQSWSYTFHETVGLQYSCFKNLWMTGSITVNPVVHDVAVTAVTPSQTQAAVGTTIPVDVTIQNEGSVPETFNVTAYYDDTIIEVQTNVSLDAGVGTTLTFAWDTTGVEAGTYTLKAQASPVLGETDTTDNVLIDGQITLSLHDIAIIGVTAAPTSVAAGEVVQVTVTVRNQGQASETFNVTAYYDAQAIETETGISLNASASIEVPFSWDTAEVPAGSYTISAEASPVPGEVNITNNEFTDGVVVITALQLPIASFTFSPEAPHVGETMTFNASTSYDPDGTLVSYFWDFGDGTNLTEADPVGTHAFAEAETYTVTLQVTDNDGLTKTATKSMTVSQPPPFPLELVAVIVIVIAAVLGGVLYYYMKRRRKL
jgi:plastocyanin